MGRCLRVASLQITELLLLLLQLQERTCRTAGLGRHGDGGGCGDGAARDDMCFSTGEVESNDELSTRPFPSSSSTSLHQTAAIIILFLNITITFLIRILDQYGENFCLSGFFMQAAEEILAV
ncbi:hypothetical protein CRUP_011497 [Coryphaenoides rupestris]|nr:hypothetical protein CRUP_011497 [Coryphaenoides rupestris]